LTTGTALSRWLIKRSIRGPGAACPVCSSCAMPARAWAASPLPLVGRACLYTCGITPYDVKGLDATTPPAPSRWSTTGPAT
jgi:hypothetical protein